MQYSLDDLIRIVELTIDLCQRTTKNSNDIVDDIKKIINNPEEEKTIINNILTFESFGYTNSRKNIIQNTINIVLNEIDTRNLSSRFVDSMKITIETLKMIKQIIEQED